MNIDKLEKIIRDFLPANIENKPYYLVNIQRLRNKKGVFIDVKDIMNINANIFTFYIENENDLNFYFQKMLPADKESAIKYIQETTTIKRKVPKNWKKINNKMGSKIPIFYSNGDDLYLMRNMNKNHSNWIDGTFTNRFFLDDYIGEYDYIADLNECLYAKITPENIETLRNRSWKYNE
jgi:hypothetical protein